MTVVKDLKQYLNEVLNIQIELQPWKKEKKIPFFIREEYIFYEGSISGNPCLFLIAREGEEISPATINNHINQLKENWPGLCVYVQSTITSYNRKRLIEKCIPFVVPGNQMYLPELGLDLREYFRKISKSRKTLSPAAQAIIIFALLHEEKKKFIPSELAKDLNYTRMTMTRAFNELKSMHIGEIARKGRERLLQFTDDKLALWEQVKSVMRNPEKKTVLLRQGERKNIERNGTISGVSALSSFTMINQPKLPVYAMSVDDWKNFIQSTAIEEVLFYDEADIELQIWAYDPKLFAKDGLVDPYSLYLNLRDSDDERIEIALESLMEKMK